MCSRGISSAELRRDHRRMRRDLGAARRLGRDQHLADAAQRRDALRDQGLVRIIYSTAGKTTPDGINAFSVTEDFSNKYPVATGAVVRAIVKAANWTAQPHNRDAVLDIWAKSGPPRKVIAEDLSGSLKDTDIPLIDELFVAGLKIGVDFSVRNKLIREPFDVDAWIDRRYVNAALRDLNLVSYWQPRHAPPSLAKE